MMDFDDIAYLDSPQGRQAVEDNLSRDPINIAFDKKLQRPGLIASQVKYLQRARKKLPAYFDARCIIPSIAFEQSSGWKTASMKSYSGELCIDLTCGLGVDSIRFSHNFGEVISVERNDELAHIAGINFKRLGSTNIKVINESAEDFIARFLAEGRKADFVYIDPDRRAETGKKVVRLEDCTPDVVALMPALEKAAEKVVIKASPLFDVDEAFRLFPGSRVTAVSADGECKEVLIEISGEHRQNTLCAHTYGMQPVCFPCPAPSIGTNTFEAPYSHLIIPDVSLRKARLTASYFNRIMPDAYCSTGDGYVFAKPSDMQNTGGENYPTIYGKVFEIEWMRPYNPKALRREFAEAGIKNADIYLQGFPHEASKICRDLGIKEGGVAKISFTRADGELWTIGLKELNLPHG